MSDLEARVWRRYGHVRIYVSRAGAKVGWYDVRAGRHEIGAPELSASFWDAVREECRKLGEPLPEALAGPTGDVAVEAPQEPPMPLPEPAATPLEPAVEPGADLGLNRAGSAAHARAVELRSWRTRLASLVGVRTEARDFAAGAKGERFIGARLDRWARKQGWHVLHAVPVGRGDADIDHVLIGPFGVVTVNTKTTRGKVWVGENGMLVGGTKVDHVRNSRHEAQRTRTLLATACGRHVPVQSVVVFVGATGFTVRKGGPKDVAVLADVKALRRWLRRRGRVLTPEQVADVREVARRPETWRT
ncbi:nuclease-related domain-containing protein [Actinomadura rubrisoli]|uniref:NERD domain-containing protein n=1 Tax=Actinomadura rubrisoli TaxID=2530368 RepID=A0A4R5B2S8_9ACTN|nr:nuclease-related domain-containing protein [Actinomadura rubrisoli]TDD80408.1 NERD domain-containing protein [Actinomadura rubrisoli]